MKCGDDTVKPIDIETCTDPCRVVYEATLPFEEGEGLIADTFASESAETRVAFIDTDTTVNEILFVIVPMNDIPSTGYIDISLEDHVGCEDMTAQINCLSPEYC